MSYKTSEILETSSAMPNIPQPHALLLLITSVNDPSLNLNLKPSRTFKALTYSVIQSETVKILPNLQHQLANYRLFPRLLGGELGNCFTISNYWLSSN